MDKLITLEELIIEKDAEIKTLEKGPSVLPNLRLHILEKKALNEKLFPRYALFLLSKIEPWMLVPIGPNNEVFTEKDLILNLEHSDNCYCESCEKETKRCVTAQEAFSRVLIKDFEYSERTKDGRLMLRHKTWSVVPCGIYSTFRDITKYKFELNHSIERCLEIYDTYGEK